MDLTLSLGGKQYGPREQALPNRLDRNPGIETHDLEPMKLSRCNNLIYSTDIRRVKDLCFNEATSASIIKGYRCTSYRIGYEPLYKPD